MARPYLKKKKNWVGEGLHQVVEKLPSKHKALNSNPIMTKKKKKTFEQSSKSVIYKTNGNSNLKSFR
jgi:hypothetical protein